MPRFMYVGDELQTTIFGLTFKQGEAVEVTDEHAVKKLSNSVLFARDDAPVTPSPKPRKKDKVDGENQG